MTTSVESPPARRRQRRKHLVENAFEEVAEASKSELALRFRRTRGENARAATLGNIDPRKPECRLSDPGRAFEHERALTIPRSLEEAAHDVELGVPADYLRACHGRNNLPPRRRLQAPAPP